jgi:hypothetical protein
MGTDDPTVLTYTESTDQEYVDWGYQYFRFLRASPTQTGARPVIRR